MPKISLEFAVDFGSLTKELEKAEQKSQDSFSKIGEGSAVSGIVSSFRDINEQIEAMAESSNRFNKTWEAGLKTDQVRLSVAKDLLKTHQAMSDLTKHEVAAAKSQGRSGGSGGGPSRGGGSGYKGRGGSRGVALGVMSGAVNLAGGLGQGLATTTDYLNLAGNTGQAAGTGLMAASAFGLVTKAMGGIGAAIYGVSEGLKKAAEFTERDDKNFVRSAGVYASAGGKGYNQYHQALKAETGWGGKDRGYGMQRFGVDQDTMAGMYAGLGKSGMLGNDLYAKENGLQVAGLYRNFGQGTSNSAMGLASIMDRGGAYEAKGDKSQKDVDVDRMNLFGAAAGVAIAQELDHGRFGESYEQMSQVAASLSARGNVDQGMVAQLVASIGSMGDRYKGTGPGASQAFGVMNQLTQGQSPMGKAMVYNTMQQDTPGITPFEMTYNLSIAGTGDQKGLLDLVVRSWANRAREEERSGRSRKDIIGQIMTEMPGITDGQALYDLLWTRVDDLNMAELTKLGRETITSKAPGDMVQRFRKTLNAVTGSSVADQLTGMKESTEDAPSTSKDPVADVRRDRKGKKALQDKVFTPLGDYASEWLNKRKRDQDKIKEDEELNTYWQERRQEGYLVKPPPESPQGSLPPSTKDSSTESGSTYWQEQRKYLDNPSARGLGGSGSSAEASQGSPAAQQGSGVMSMVSQSTSMASANQRELAQYSTGATGQFGRKRNVSSAGDKLPEGQKREHQGIDLNYGAGNPVYSPVNGTVMRGSPRFLSQKKKKGGSLKLGWTVEILGEDGYKYRLLHLDETVKRHVHAGKEIKKGSILCDGLFRGLRKPHVHAEVRKGPGAMLPGKGGEAVDPASVFQLESLRNPNAGSTGTGGGGEPSAVAGGIHAEHQGGLTAGVGARGASGGTGAGSSPVTVNLVITDNTTHKVSVVAKQHEVQSRMPATGDLPTLHGGT